MGHLDLFGVSPCDSDSLEELLEQFDSSIVVQTKELAYHHSDFVHPAIFDLEIDEIVQNVRIKLWRVLQVKHIQYPHAYIKRMVRNEFINYLRRHKPLQPLPTDDDGELYQGDLMVMPSAGMSDPADEVEQKWAVDQCLEKVAGAISALPPRQQFATLCSLVERVDNLVQLIDAFKLYHLDVVEIAEWPDEEIDVQRLKASISAARRRIARYMEVKLPEQKSRGVAVTPLFCTEEVEV